MLVPSEVFESPVWNFSTQGFPTTQEVRAYLEGNRKYCEKKQNEGANGLFLVELHSSIMDQLLCHLFVAAETEYFAKRSRQGQHCTLTAIGGYGRKELCPFSDIDLLFLYPHKIDAYMEFVAERMLYGLWDSGLEVGHSIRTQEQCLHIAEEDLREATSMLDMRFICGKPELVSELTLALQGRIFSKKSLEHFIRVKVDDLRLRHQKYGESVYLLEPNVKQGRGGLRDINTVEWLLKANFKMEADKAIRTLGLLSKDDAANFHDAKDGILRLRFFLHLRSGRRQDILDFDSQQTAAITLGFQDQQQGLAVEQFMQQYYRNAARIERYVESILYRLAPPRSSTAARLFRRVTRRSLDHGLVLHGGFVNPGREDLFAQDPIAMMAIFGALQKHEAKLTPACRELIRSHLSLIDEQFRCNSMCAKIFVDIFREPKGVFDTLDAAHRSGLFSAFIPEFAHLYCLVLHDLYHIYTVDTHLLFAVRELEMLAGGKVPKALEMAANVLTQVTHFHILAMAVLFHDIGKGMGKGHSERGAEMMPKIGERLGLPVQEMELLTDLVRHHLLMAHITQRRDFRESKQLLEFCQTMKNPETLRCLYILTICDIRAVSPEIWSDWKGTLLNELYMRALQVFEAGSEEGERKRVDLHEHWQKACKALGKDVASEKQLNEIYQVLPPRFLESNLPESLSRYLKWVLAKDLSAEQGVHARVQGTSFAEKGFCELLIYTLDQSGLFAKICGVISANRLNIISVETSTWADGRVLDIFRVVNLLGEVEVDEQVVLKINQELNEVIAGKRKVDDLVVKLKPSKILSKPIPRAAPVQVNIRNDVSDFCTVVEVFASDRIGLLYDIAKVLSEKALYIQTALISTDVDQITDVFYLKDRLGNKLGSAESQEVLRSALLEIVESNTLDA